MKGVAVGSMMASDVEVVVSITTGVFTVAGWGAGMSDLMLQLNPTPNKIIRTAQRSAGEICLKKAMAPPIFELRVLLSLSSNSEANWALAVVCSATWLNFCTIFSFSGLISFVSLLFIVPPPGQGRSARAGLAARAR